MRCLIAVIVGWTARPRGIHHAEHDEATSAACFIGLIGFLSAQVFMPPAQPTCFGLMEDENDAILLFAMDHS